MKGVTRKHIHINLTATGWLIRRFLTERFSSPSRRGFLKRLALIVHGADFPEKMDTTRESAGLWVISQGFTDIGRDDAETLERASFLYDALDAHLRS